MTTTSTTPTVYPGDDIIPEAAMVYDRRRIVDATPEEIRNLSLAFAARQGEGRVVLEAVLRAIHAQILERCPPH